MTKRPKIGKRIMFVGIVIFAVIVAFLAFYMFQRITSPYNLARYGAESTRCKHREMSNTCTIIVTIKNNSSKKFTPDFTGTDGPGFAESGVWGVYVINSKGEKTKGFLDREEYGTTIPPHTAVQAPVVVQLEPDLYPDRILIYDHSIKLSPN